jgi:hypothetical protein
MDHIILIKGLNIFGLCLNVGGALLMIFNTPHAQAPEHTNLSQSFSRREYWMMTGRLKEKTRVLLTRIGLGVMIFGFFFQVIACSWS